MKPQHFKYNVLNVTKCDGVIVIKPYIAYDPINDNNAKQL